MRGACAGSKSGHTSANAATGCVYWKWGKKVGACVLARARIMHVCTKSSVCIGVGTRKVKSASERRSPAETEKVCAAVQICRPIFVENLCFAAFHAVCVHAWACSSLSKILKPKLSSQILSPKCNFFIHYSCLTLVKNNFLVISETTSRVHSVEGRPLPDNMKRITNILISNYNLITYFSQYL